MNWHIVTCEYPPQSGGVSDYTNLVAEGLAEAGDEVHVWCPGEERRAKGEGAEQRAGGRRQEAEGSEPKSGVTVHREFGKFLPSDLRRVGKQLDQFAAPRKLLVQWVPHGYGNRSMNLPFCFWLWRRARFKGDEVQLMIHEPFLAFGEGSRKQDLAAAVHRLMIMVLLEAASQIWISTQEWETHLSLFLFGRKKPIEWLPVPSTIPAVDDPDGIRSAREKYAKNGTRLVGHFGAYNDYMAEAMSKVIPSLLNGENHFAMLLLLGNGSKELRDRLVHLYPQLSGRMHATGQLPADEISRHISACDVMWQPYQDGISGRRTSVMVALSHGVPVITTTGHLTEALWAATNAVMLTPVEGISCLPELTVNLLVDSSECERRRSAAKKLYSERFDIKHTVEALRAERT